MNKNIRGGFYIYGRHEDQTDTDTQNIYGEQKKAEITGVNDVISFDLNTILLETDTGMITIKEAIFMSASCQ